MERDKYLKTAMSMIASAGDGRALISQALEAAKKNDFAASEALMTQAYANIRQAHLVQTEVIQNTMSHEELEDEAAKLLFTHAQDTLMTINSEYILSKEMIAVMRMLEERIRKVEEKLNEQSRVS